MPKTSPAIARPVNGSPFRERKERMIAATPKMIENTGTEGERAYDTANQGGGCRAVWLSHGPAAGNIAVIFTVPLPVLILVIIAVIIVHGKTSFVSL